MGPVEEYGTAPLFPPLATFFQPLSHTSLHMYVYHLGNQKSPPPLSLSNIMTSSLLRPFPTCTHGQISEVPLPLPPKIFFYFPTLYPNFGQAPVFLSYFPPYKVTPIRHQLLFLPQTQNASPPVQKGKGVPMGMGGVSG